VYGELAYEYRGESRSQVKFQVLHIIDAAFLGGKDVRTKHLKERYGVFSFVRCLGLSKQHQSDDGV
jgi:hypothetical protein